MKHFAIVIPVFHPTVHFEQLLQRLNSIYPQLPGNWRILIVDDGSPRWPELSFGNLPYVVLRHQQNRGKGAALKTAFAYLEHSDTQWEAVITMDGDLQHQPEDIPAFLECYERTQADIILGARNRSPRIMPLHRIASNHLTSLIISLITGTMVKDSQSGFRLLRWKTLRNVRPSLQENRFHLESEMVLRIAHRGGIVRHVPIPTIYNSAPSAIKHWADTLNFIQLILRFMFERWWG